MKHFDPSTLLPPTPSINSGYGGRGLRIIFEHNYETDEK